MPWAADYRGALAMGVHHSHKWVDTASLLALLLAPLASLASARHKEKEVVVLAFPNGEEEVYERGPLWWWSVPVIAPVGAACVGFKGILQPASFFKGLKCVKTPDGLVCRQGPRTISDYPDEIKLFVSASPSYCSTKERVFPLPPWPTGDWPPDSVKSPGAEAAYIRDLKLYPLEIGLAEEGENVNVRLHARPPVSEPLYPMEYTFVIRTKGVRLADPLVVTLFTKNGERLVRFAFRP